MNKSEMSVENDEDKLSEKLKKGDTLISEI